MSNQWKGNFQQWVRKNKMMCNVQSCTYIQERYGDKSLKLTQWLFSYSLLKFFFFTTGILTPEVFIFTSALFTNVLSKFNWHCSNEVWILFDIFGHSQWTDYKITPYSFCTRAAYWLKIYRSWCGKGVNEKGLVHFVDM